MARLAASEPSPPKVAGVRVVIDARPMQEPERAPLTADYLRQLLGAFARAPLAGESFVIVSRAMREDPAPALAEAGLPVAGRRRVPPTTRALRSAGMTLDSFLLRGAEIGTSRGTGSAGEGSAGSGGAVFHTAGGAVPVASGLPLVATLLDLAPWELPSIYAANAAARFGQRLRARVLHDAARVIVCSRASAETARRVLHLPADRLAVVPLAVDDAFRAAGRQPDLVNDTRQRLGLPPRYFVFAGRYDARKDMRTLYEALRSLRIRNRQLQMVLVLTSSSADERAVVTRAVERNGLVDTLRIVVPANAAERAQVIGGSEAFVYPALSEATAMPVLEALSLGVPVICSRAGALPEAVASAGIVVAPRDPERLSAAIEAIWDGGSLAQQLRSQAHRRAAGVARSWADVARETRAVYADAAANAA